MDAEIPVAPVAPEDWGRSWDETCRTGCQLIVEAGGRVASVQIVGEVMSDPGSGRLQRLIELAQSAGAEFGVAVSVAYDHHRPCLHLSFKRQPVVAVSGPSRTQPAGGAPDQPGTRTRPAP